MSYQPRPLQGRIAIVTGAGRAAGIGAAICRTLAADGANVLFTTWRAYDRALDPRDSDWPAPLLAELRACGVRSASLEIDLARLESAGQVLDAVEAQLGTASILVNNAAHSTATDAANLDAAALDAHYAVNVRATALLCVEFARRLPADMAGRIVNLTSGQGLGPMPGELAYAASKGAVDAFSASLSAELAPRGITVNAVDPGPTDSGWMTDQLKAALLPRFPQGRAGQPDDAARLVAFLASDAARWITGQVIHADGGFRRW
jgi:3-oxoacyl-[acyl-carrier protein] reductase